MGAPARILRVTADDTSSHCRGLLSCFRSSHSRGLHTLLGTLSCLRSSHSRGLRTSSWVPNAQGTNPLREMAAQAPKVRTLCSKWQLEPKSTNPLLKMAAGAPKVRTLCPKYKLERPRYNLSLKQVALTFGLLPIMRSLLGELARKVLFFGKCFGNARKTLRRTFRKMLCGAPQAPHSEVKPVGKQCARAKDIAECGRI